MSGQQADADASHRYRVFVVELDDRTGARRRPDRPNLHVGVTCRTDLDSVLKSKRRAVVRDHGVRLRPDLTKSYPATTERDARRQETKLRHKLMRQGYTVNGDRRVWRLYVIELDEHVGLRVDATLPWVYVGETSKTPEERLDEHLTGARNRRGRLYAPVVLRHGLRLLPDLYEREPVLFTAEDAKRAEAALGDRLRQQGYSVKGAH